MQLLLLVMCLSPLALTQHQHQDGLLTLNRGEKWQLDEPSRKSVRHIQTIYSDSKKQSPSELGAELRKGFNELVAGCRMKGPAHDQLHIVLGELIQGINAMTDEDTKNDEHAMALVDTSLKRLDQYFE